MMRLLPLCALLLLPACDNFRRLGEIGKTPDLAPLSSPSADPAWRTVSMPMPPPPPAPTEAASLWRGSRTFLRDQRAAQVGDLVTVLVGIEDRAQLENSTARSRNNSEAMGIPHLLGLDSSIARVAPPHIDPSNMVDLSSANSSVGAGSIKRNEAVTLRVATTVMQTLSNGNLVVAGRQQVRVNAELRDLQVSGIIRPQDIASDNTVRHDRLAEARIAYGGRGTVSDVQMPRYGQQFLDVVLPF
ncbi:flagellar basal body L-ring protein FlgH [Roseicella aquatilis]|uniref:Flagellar L-ring protein n=1 Tax=Roseicella aquatilis TaxID=2527868 RepID=A0A4R4D373_9PROT|nr:flagellar basal body L-ring protein FlgH [Roseicella aquatilis]TCZ53682.1 flagellar basal body L-ring protein FlgH [Roseicella aquatilis]